MPTQWLYDKCFVTSSPVTYAWIEPHVIITFSYPRVTYKRREVSDFWVCSSFTVRILTSKLFPHLSRLFLVDGENGNFSLLPLKWCSCLGQHKYYKKSLQLCDSNRSRPGVCPSVCCTGQMLSVLDSWMFYHKVRRISVQCVNKI